ncbi:cytochrome P450 [Phellopilus nigrolimitatus]|nr:cytochrome P450 [Phellopilus nigrolimitatus]
MIVYLVDVVVVACALKYLQLWFSLYKRRTATPKYPPGPKGLPLVGNYFEMPPDKEWEKAKEWGEQYGSLVFFRNFGTPYLFLNTYEAAVNLFEKRGHNYSSRPENVMVELEGFSRWFPSALPYGDELKRTRQLTHRYFQPSAVEDYAELQTRSAYRMLLGILNAPDKFPAVLRHSAGESIMMVTYGYQVKESDDPYVALADKGLAAFIEASGFFLVNALPWLRHLPAWFPGTSFHAIAKEGYKHSMAMYHEPHKMAKAIISDGTAAPSMTSKFIESKTAENGAIKDEDLLAKTTGVMYAAGADTTVSSLLTFILAMVLNPEEQRRGQEEVDRVIGRDSLPTMKDRPDLPFVDALCKEVLRWQIVGPVGLAHAVADDDVYDGYLIPGGTSVYANLWAMSRDPKEYPEPEKFIPDRWLPKKGTRMPLDVSKIVFGIGRRICPGRFFADNAVFIGIASLLSAFNIQKALDENGVPITPTEEYTTNFIRHPKPFKCKITPRSEKTASLIRQAVESSG